LRMKRPRRKKEIKGQELKSDIMPPKKTGKKMRFKTGIFLLLYMVIPFSLAAKTIKVSAQVGTRDVHTGEAFILQIVIDGSNQVKDPDLSGLKTWFRVAYAGGGPQNSQSITVINGQMTKKVSHKYVYQYQLTPLKKGILTIPPIMVNVEGRSYLTEAIRLQVKEPGDVAEFKLRQYLSENSCFIGEPVLLTVEWYLQNEVKSPYFTVPILEDSRFRIEDYKGSSQGKQEYKIRIGKEEVSLIQSEKKLQGDLYTTLTFKKILIPRSAGLIEIPKATLVFNGVSGNRQARDFFGRLVREPAYKKYVIASRSRTLTVKNVPQQGKPENYSGLVGTFTVEAMATPLEVNVGDPITLTITLKGRGNLKDGRLPHLHQIKKLTKDFKIPEEIAAGTIRGNQKIFTQTIRATHQDIKEIPSLSISYFNSKTEKYQYAKSGPISLKVSPSSEFTMAQIEGIDRKTMKKELEEIKAGISYNYEGEDVLENRPINILSYIQKPVIIAMMITPLLVYLILFYFLKIRPSLSRNENQKLKTRKAYNRLINKLNPILKGKYDFSESKNIIFDELRNYLGSKLKKTTESITFEDIDRTLEKNSVPAETINKVKKIFHKFDAMNYASISLEQNDINELCRDILQAVKEIERSYK